MGVPPNFPRDPHAILEPNSRWTPAKDAERNNMPPLVPALRVAVKEWRDSDYKGADKTSKALLNWWFNTEHRIEQQDGSTVEFQYYFAQREALETIIYLHDVARVKKCFDLMDFDAPDGIVSKGMFDEVWRRFVVKMATGSGKTKVISLAMAWCYFHKLYEPESDLARNFLLVAPNIIVLDRLRTDFDGCTIFREDPVIPKNGWEGQNWESDFSSVKVHIQDEANVVQKTGNIFLTNIQRIYLDNTNAPSKDDANTADYFLGKRPTGATTDSKVKLHDIVKDVEELVVINDEAHHIHNKKLAWFESIQDIHLRLKQRGTELALQIDVTATPKHEKGHVFVQTISDYPLVEAIHQNVVKRPLVPDKPSQAKLHEGMSSRFVEKYADYINLGIEEWRKIVPSHEKLGKKAILFVMTDDTKNCDAVAEYLESKPEFKGAVLTIHTNKSGEISETITGKKAKELEELRNKANTIDNENSPYKAIVSVLMLKEGWDVKNVTTIVGLRPYSSKSNILPEQTLGRGLRKMYRDNSVVSEYVSVVGTKAFMEFVESIQAEGVELEEWQMGRGTEPKVPMIIEVDRENPAKNIEQLDIEIPILNQRYYSEHRNLENITPASFDHKKLPYKQYSEEEKREIVFYDIATTKETHRTKLDGGGEVNYQDTISYFTDTIIRHLHLVSGHAVLFGLIEEFVTEHLFTKRVPLKSRNTLRNLAEPRAVEVIIESFKSAINKVALDDKGEAGLKNYMRVSDARPFRAQDQKFHTPQKSVFNKIIGDSSLELDFARFLDDCVDIVSYAKNYFAVAFKLDYINANGDISNYFPDFIVKKSATEVFIVETKGLVSEDDLPKMKRLRAWCEDVNKVSEKVKYNFVYVDEERFNKYKPTTFDDLVQRFTKHKD